VPSLFTTLIGTEYDWNYDIHFDKDIGHIHKNKMAKMIRGKMLGGSSSINFELYARGEPADYDEWNEVAPGWDWQTVLPYFKKLENMTDPTVFNDPYHAKLHSTDGPIKISRPVHNLYFRTINQILLESFEEIGVKRILEMNGLHNLGVTIPHFTFADGRRSSTAEGYLRPVKHRHNLYVAKNARVTKVLIDPLSLNAYGVQILNQHGELVNIYAKKEVILSAGSIDTPKLLMLSGIGPRRELKRHNIKILRNLPVGKNLQDHPFIPLVFTGERGLGSSVQHFVSVTELNGAPLPMQNGFLNLNRVDGRRQLQFVNVHVGAFASPVIQVACGSITYAKEFCSSIARVNLLNAMDVMGLALIRPESRGQVTLRSRNPLDNPVIEGGLLQREEDIEVLTEGVRFLERLVNTTYYRSVKGTLEKLNVPRCRKFVKYPRMYWRCYVKTTVGSLQHPVGTCAMGADGVVDERLRVHGVYGLRVVDASVMPLIPGGNTNTPSIMIGEKAADMIKQEYMLFS
jgi:choline dehydrogenase